VVSSAIAQGPTSQLVDSETVLKSALVEALKTTEQIRQKDRSTMIDCTRTFENFNPYKTTMPYMAFFKRIGVPMIVDDRNNRHYVAFQLNHTQLKAIGFDKFLPHDRVVIVFTTRSAASDEITSFEVTLLNTNHL
jgi:hypothetical protein